MRKKVVFRWRLGFTRPKKFYAGHKLTLVKAPQPRDIGHTVRSTEDGKARLILTYVVAASRDALESCYSINAL